METRSERYDRQLKKFKRRIEKKVEENTATELEEAFLRYEDSEDPASTPDTVDETRTASEVSPEIKVGSIISDGDYMMRVDTVDEDVYVGIKLTKSGQPYKRNAGYEISKSAEITIMEG